MMDVDIMADEPQTVLDTETFYQTWWETVIWTWVQVMEALSLRHSIAYAFVYPLM